MSSEPETTDSYIKINFWLFWSVFDQKIVLIDNLMINVNESYNDIFLIGSAG